MIKFMLAVVGGYLVALLLGMPVAWPYDYMMNVGSTPVRLDLRPPDDGKRRVVVLQHGLLRSSTALLRLERTLRSHGYEVHNLDYPSTMATLEEHAERLAQALAEVRKPGPTRGAVSEWFFVGHSMGGLVIQEYLRRPEVQAPSACVYIATPHRGAGLADLRKHWFLFRLIMGTKAASQLSPGCEFHRQPIPFLGQTGTIFGDIGAGNRSIPGNDDGTVGVEEARLEDAAATLGLPFGHTRIASHPETAEQVLAFLHHRKFEKR